MSADEFLKDSHPVNVQEDEDCYNAAAAHYYQIAQMESEDIEVTEMVGMYASRAIPGLASLNDNENFL